jgi:hypothetical protein
MLQYQAKTLVTTCPNGGGGEKLASVATRRPPFLNGRNDVGKQVGDPRPKEKSATYFAQPLKSKDNLKRTVSFSTGPHCHDVLQQTYVPWGEWARIIKKTKLRGLSPQVKYTDRARARMTWQKNVSFLPNFGNPCPNPPCTLVNCYPCQWSVICGK